MALQDTDPDHGDGENYFVSMTDMMVGLLFIFIILLMSFALMFRQQTDVQQSVTAKQLKKIEVAEEVGRTLDDIENRIRLRLSEVQEATRLRLRLLNELKTRLSREGLVVEISPSGDVLRLTESAVRFEPDRSILQDFQGSDTPKKNVGKIARALASVLPGYAVCQSTGPSQNCRTDTQASIETVFIEGHTDETGRDDRNWILSAERAANTYRELISISPELRLIFNRRREEVLSISGYASTRRIDLAGSRDAWRNNRRIDLRFVMDVDTTVGLGEMGALLQRMRSAIEQLKSDLK